MKKPFKLTTALIAGAMLASSTQALADVSANIGLTSQYFYRGVQQTDSASASAGLDYEKGGFYLGTWAADVKDGIEVDFYGGYNGETESGITWGIGATTFQYTGDFDSAYNELNFSLGYGLFSLGYNVGRHESDSDLNIVESDYSFTSLTIEKDGFYGTVGLWGKDSDGEYFELGYGKEIGGFDVSVALISNSKELDVEDNKGQENLILSISKTF